MNTKAQLLFFCPLYSLEVNEQLGRGEQAGKLFLTNDLEFTKTIIVPAFEEWMGKLEYGFGLRVPILYSIAPLETSLSGDEILCLLNDFLGEARKLLTSLWLVKDHSATLGCGFVAIIVDGKFGMHSNWLAGTSYTSAGIRSTVSFDRDELREARQSYRNFCTKFLTAANAHFYAGAQQAALLSHKKSSRIGRAFFFLDAARSTPDLGLKIANYCVCLEVLFAAGAHVEITHQICERIAHFLENEQTPRIATYKRAKEAYGIRSKVLHGDVIPKHEVNDMVQIASDVDMFIRRAFKLILATDESVILFEGPAENLNDCFVRMVVGGDRLG